MLGSDTEEEEGRGLDTEPPPTFLLPPKEWSRTTSILTDLESLFALINRKRDCACEIKEMK